MSDLAAKTCVPCGGGVPPLKGEDLSILQKQIDGWNIVEEHRITKTFKFPDFRGAPEMQHGVRGTSIYMIQTATNCHLPKQSAKTARFVHYRQID